MPKPPHVLRQGFETVSAFLACLWVPLLPRRAVILLAHVAGTAGYFLCPRLRAITLANLEAAFGERLSVRQRRRIARRSFTHFGQVALDLFWFARWPHRRLTRWVRVDPTFRYLQEAGTSIAVTGHIGSWEVLGQAAALHGAAAMSVAAPLPNPYLHRMLTRMREQTGQKVVLQDGAIRKLFSTLRKGGRVALLLDQNTKPKEGGVFVPFFGLPVPVSSAVAELAVRTGARIVPAYCRLEPDGAYRIFARPPICAPADANVTDVTAQIAAALEQAIREDPGQWLWMYKRWKYRPDDTVPAERYPFYSKRLGGMA